MAFRWMTATIAAAALAAAGVTVRAETLPCEVGAIQAKAPAGTTITKAAVVDASGAIPRHCLVDGHAVSSGNTVNVRLALPDAWNGKFLFLGVGGLGGTIANLEPGLRRGYATASTDTGHQASEPDWASNRAKEIDYGHRGTHVATVAAKAVTAGFFGTAPRYAYFNGCSNGGRQALMEVQRYPGDFDGIIGGDPATGTPMQVGARHRLPEDAGVTGQLPHDRGSRAALSSLGGGVRQDGWSRGRAGERSARLPLRPLDVGMQRACRAGLVPDERPARGREAGLRRDETEER